MFRRSLEQFAGGSNALATSVTQQNNVNASWNNLSSVLQSYSNAQWATPEECTFARASASGLAACNSVHHHCAKANLDGWL